MKKLITLAFALLVTGLLQAEPTASSYVIIPAIATTDSNALVSSFADQFKAALTKDMSVSYAHTSSDKDKYYAITSLLQGGHYKGDYIAALDFGGVNSSELGSGLTGGIHAHVVPFILDNVPMNPDLAGFLSHVEITPRWSLDGENGHLKGTLSYMLGAKWSY